ncbi:MAG: carboxypeptidase regulatory-like domain-containing protein [Hormoscilla sp. GUM202]|nr:carboxypeptidase regulatory-like domain-containing protein [Hormoscilla sp. GUM202]
MSEWMKLEGRSRQVTIAGLVRNAQTGQGIAGVRVQITGMPAALQAKIDFLAQLYGEDWKQRPDRTQTRPDGYFYFLDLPDGDYTLRADWLEAGTRYGSAELPKVTVSRDSEDQINILAMGEVRCVIRCLYSSGEKHGNHGRSYLVEIPQNLYIDKGDTLPTIDLQPTSLTGIIRNENGKALVMAKVQLEGSGEYTYSDRNGNYSMIGLEASDKPRQVKVDANGYQSQVAGIVLTKGQVRTLNMSLASVRQ